MDINTRKKEEKKLLNFSMIRKKWNKESRTNEKIEVENKSKTPGGSRNSLLKNIFKTIRTFRKNIHRRFFLHLPRGDNNLQCTKLHPGIFSLHCILLVSNHLSMQSFATSDNILFFSGTRSSFTSGFCSLAPSN